MNKNENEKMQDVFEYLCNDLKLVLSKNIFQENEQKQKLYATSAFLEFLKAGASVEVLPIEDGKATFVINMK